MSDRSVLDCFVVCAKCKHMEDSDLYSGYPICLKRLVIRTTPEGITDNYYKVTWEALEQFRKENNGRCPHFKERHGLFSFIGKIISKLIRKEQNK